MRWVYREVTHGSHNSNSPLVLELLWRDYFRFMFKKHGKQFYSAERFKDAADDLAPNQEELFEKWKTGNTGVPFVDASVRELNLAGYIPNNNRQAVAVYLAHELKVDWRMGAAYFEEKLIDYSPASNLGNWAFVAGVEHDPKDKRYFLSPKQISELESQTPYISTWLPEVLAEHI